ncbi:MAG: sulfatase [Candidatus Omnitrophica bacterium]|nr:sulfatase [Candidatus Omnitrophota bacterium]MDD5513058.1 sulfatase [Candidatus Omnitrophota bacterium]
MRTGNRLVKRFIRVTLLLGCILQPLSLSPAAEVQDQPNIIVITLDALRPDHLGCYGYRRRTSENIDRMAQEGTLFTDAYSPAPWTGGALASFLTATFPSTHKIDNFNMSFDERLTTVAEVLKNSGYYTAAGSEKGRLFKLFPAFQNGFFRILDSSESSALINDSIELVNNSGNKRFFLWLHLSDLPHAPYQGPRPFNQLFVSQGEPRRIPIGKDNDFYGVIPKWVAEDIQDDTEYYIAQYDGEIAYADSLIGKLREAVEARGLDKKTVFIISADHGESLGERNVYFQHGDNLYNEEIKIPLIFFGPGIPRSKIIKDPVQLVDLAPTICNLAGTKMRFSGITEGKSFLPLFSDQARAEDSLIFAEIEGEKIISGKKRLALQKAVIAGNWKLISEQIGKTSFNFELYDLANDPEEAKNLILSHPSHAELLRSALQRYTGRNKLETVVKLETGQSDVLQELKSLGYLN